MALLLKIVSVVYLTLVWIACFAMIGDPSVRAAFGGWFTPWSAIVLAASLSIPALALFAFGQVVGDIRTVRRYLTTDEFIANRATIPVHVTKPPRQDGYQDELKGVPFMKLKSGHVIAEFGDGKRYTFDNWDKFLKALPAD